METKFLVIIFLIIGVILGSHLFCSCTSLTVNGAPANLENVVKEAFVSRNAASVRASASTYDPVSDWENAALNYAKNVGSHDNTKSGQYYKGGTIPLPPGELLIFAENPIKPECCPSYYSSSTGCVCASQKQMAYLNQRGGNRTLTSEF